MRTKIADGSIKIAIIGLGYVGLPLAVAFGKKFDTVGFDVKESRIAELRSGRDNTLETTPEELREAVRLRYTSDPEALRDRDIFIVTVPTPVDRFNTPDLTPLLRASETVGKAIRPGGMGTSPMIERAIMLLPHPDSPMMPTVCRGSTFRFTLSRTLTIPIFVENST